MSDESLKKVLIALGIVIILIFIIFAIIIASKNKNPFKEVEYYDKERAEKIEAIDSEKITGKYKSKLYNQEYINLTQEERTEIDDIIDHVILLINNRDIDNIWEYLNKSYRSRFFPEKDYLVRYLNRNYPDSKTYESLGFEVSDSSLYIIIGSNESGDDMEECIKIDNFNDENKDMYFGRFSYYEDISLLSEVDDVILISYSIFHYQDGVSVVFRIRNKTDKEAKVSFTNCLAYVQNARTYQTYPLLKDYEFDIQANDMEMCEIKFKSFSKSIQKMELNMMVNDKTYSAKTVYVSYEGI